MPNPLFFKHFQNYPVSLADIYFHKDTASWFSKRYSWMLLLHLLIFYLDFIGILFTSLLTLLLELLMISTAEPAVKIKDNRWKRSEFVWTNGCLAAQSARSMILVQISLSLHWFCNINTYLLALNLAILISISKTWWYLFWF